MVFRAVLIFTLFLAFSLFGLTDMEKQSRILGMADELCGAMPPELVLAIIRQEGGAGAFYCEGWRYNSFYSQEGSPWAQPLNGDGIMQVTEASGWHERSGTYYENEQGYRNTIEDGCGYLNELYNSHDSIICAALHYNSGPNTLYIYMNGMGDKTYMQKLADHLLNFVPEVYGIENRALAEGLYEAQRIVDGYISSLPEGMSKDYYKEYQMMLDEEIKNI